MLDTWNSPWGISKLNLIDDSKSEVALIIFPDICCCGWGWLIIELLLLALLSTNEPLFDPKGSKGLVIFLLSGLFGLFELPVPPAFAACCCCCCDRTVTTVLSPCRTICELFMPLLLGPPAKTSHTKDAYNLNFEVETRFVVENITLSFMLGFLVALNIDKIKIKQISQRKKKRKFSIYRFDYLYKKEQKSDTNCAKSKKSLLVFILCRLMR